MRDDRGRDGSMPDSGRGKRIAEFTEKNFGRLLIFFSLAVFFGRICRPNWAPGILES